LLSRKDGTAEAKREILLLLQFRPNPAKRGIFKAVPRTFKTLTKKFKPATEKLKVFEGKFKAATKKFKLVTKCGSGQMDLRILSRIPAFDSEAKRIHPTYASSKDGDLQAVMQLFESVRRRVSKIECGLLRPESRKILICWKVRDLLKCMQAQMRRISVEA
jgi:hypothetical protein